MRRFPKTSVFAIFMIGALDFYAIHRGVDGVALTAAITAIAGIGGWQIGKRIGQNGGDPA